MKIKIFSLAILTAIVFSCTSEEASETQVEQQLVVASESDQGRSFGPGTGFSNFNCDPLWTPDTLPNNAQGTTIQVYYSDDPADWPGGVIDIDCARQEYFKFFCGLFMAQLQDQDPYHDTWKRNPDLDPTGCLTKSKDHVNTSSNDDPRVCTGSDCD